MTDPVAQQIADEHDRRHNHYSERNVSRCSNCGGFVSKGTPENGQVRYFCSSCSCWQLEWTGGKQATRT
jgi:hypothetical protein